MAAKELSIDDANKLQLSVDITSQVVYSNVPLVSSESLTKKNSFVLKKAISFLSNKTIPSETANFADKNKFLNSTSPPDEHQTKSNASGILQTDAEKLNKTAIAEQNSATTATGRRELWIKTMAVFTFMFGTVSS